MNVGSVMLPPIILISKFLRLLTTGVAWFAEKCPIITGGIMGIISVLILAKIAVVGFGYAFALAGSGALALKAILHGSLGSTLISLSARLIPAVIGGFKTLTLAIASNPIGAVVAGLSVGAALVIANWQKVKDFFSGFWKSILKPIGEFFNWFGNGSLKEFENKNPLVKAEIGSTLKTINVLHNENPLWNHNTLKKISENKKSIIESIKINSVIEEKSFVANDSEKVLKDCAKCKSEQKVFNQSFAFNISIKAEPNQDVRSLADAVLKRIREKSRDVLFDTVEPIY